MSFIIEPFPNLTKALYLKPPLKRIYYLKSSLSLKLFELLLLFTCRKYNLFYKTMRVNTFEFVLPLINLFTQEISIPKPVYSNSRKAL